MDKWKFLIVTLNGCNFGPYELFEILHYIRPRLNRPYNKMVEVGAVLGTQNKNNPPKYVKASGFPPGGMELPDEIIEFDLSVQSILRGPVQKWIETKMGAMGFLPQHYSIERA